MIIEPVESPPRPVRGRRRRRLVLLVPLMIAALLVMAGVSYVRALTYPGDASVGVRTVEWVRDHGGGPVVDAVENWWYSRNAPSGAAPAAAELPAPAPAGPPVVGAARVPGSLPVLAGALPVAGEGAWSAGARTPDGRVALYTGFERPDPSHPSVVAGVAWLNQDLVRTRLLAGTREPVPVNGARAQVPMDMRSGLVADFNSGWKIADAHGGWYAEGHVLTPLVDGAASVVIDPAGRVRIGQWGRDGRLGPDVAAVRQNLRLVVDAGAPVPGLADNADGSWGTARNQFQYTWRSGLGVDAAGNLIYLAGDKLTLATLARALAGAGVVRGLELDIHPEMVSFNVFGPDVPGSVPTRLLPGMSSSPQRYLSPDQRDFFAVGLAPAPAPARRS